MRGKIKIIKKIEVQAQLFLDELFENEYCAECGKDKEDHTAIPTGFGWFARCDKPVPESTPEQLEPCPIHNDRMAKLLSQFRGAMRELKHG